MKSNAAIAMALALTVVCASGASAASCRIEERVAKVVSSEYGKKPGEVSPGGKFAVDGPGTIEDVEIKLMIEEEFKIKIADAAWAKLTYIKDISNYLRKQLKGCG